MSWDRRNKPRAQAGHKIPPAQRNRIINKARRDGTGCWFKYQGICVGLTGKIEVHHVIEHADGGPDDDENLVAACKPCHTHYSAQESQKRAVEAAWDWRRRPEKHPGVLD